MSMDVRFSSPHTALVVLASRKRFVITIYICAAPQDFQEKRLINFRQDFYKSVQQMLTHQSYKFFIVYKINCCIFSELIRSFQKLLIFESESTTGFWIHPQENCCGQLIMYGHTRAQHTFLDFGFILQAHVPWSSGVGVRSVHHNSPQIYQNMMSLLHI